MQTTEDKKQLHAIKQLILITAKTRGGIDPLKIFLSVSERQNIFEKNRFQIMTRVKYHYFLKLDWFVDFVSSYMFSGPGNPNKSSNIT